MGKKNFNGLLEEQTLQIWIDGLADALKYITLTDSQGAKIACFT